MKLHIEAPWRATKEEAMSDQKLLIEMFDLKHDYSYQFHPGFEDGLCHKAGCHVDSDVLTKIATAAKR